MPHNNGPLVDVFPITTSAFGLSANWFDAYIPKLVHPAFLLMTLLLVVAIGIMALRRFEDPNLEKKLWNIPVIIIVITVWPILILGLKDLIDTFNTFLVSDIFRIRWEGFGFPKLHSVIHIFSWSIDGLDSLLPNLAYWIVYAFYIVFFFFFAALGPFILAKGILQDEIDGFLELLKEITNLFLWQTMMVILVAFIMPSIVSGDPFPDHPNTNLFFLSVILAVMILFVPSMTRKFTGMLGGPFIPRVFKLGGAAMAFGAIGKLGTMGLSASGMPGAAKVLGQGETVLHGAVTFDETKKKYQNFRKIQKLEHQNEVAEHELHQQHEDESYQHHIDDESKEKAKHLVENLKKAKEELRKDNGEKPEPS